MRSDKIRDISMNFDSIADTVGCSRD